MKTIIGNTRINGYVDVSSGIRPGIINRIIDFDNLIGALMIWLMLISLVFLPQDDFCINLGDVFPFSFRQFLSKSLRSCCTIPAIWTTESDNDRIVSLSIAWSDLSSPISKQTSAVQLQLQEQGNGVSSTVWHEISVLLPHSTADCELFKVFDHNRWIIVPNSSPSSCKRLLLFLHEIELLLNLNTFLSPPGCSQIPLSSKSFATKTFNESKSPVQAKQIFSVATDILTRTFTGQNPTWIWTGPFMSHMENFGRLIWITCQVVLNFQRKDLI